MTYTDFHFLNLRQVQGEGRYMTLMLSLSKGEETP